ADEIEWSIESDVSGLVAPCFKELIRGLTRHALGAGSRTNSQADRTQTDKTENRFSQDGLHGLHRRSCETEGVTSDAGARSATSPTYYRKSFRGATPSCER